MAASQIQAAEAGLVPLLRHVVANVRESASEHDVVEGLNRLVAGFIDLQGSGALG